MIETGTPPLPQLPPLLPRYRRLLSFATVVDEPISLFRRAWRSLLAPLAISVIPVGIIGIVFTQWMTGSMFAALQRSTSASAVANPDQFVRTMGGFYGGAVLYSLLYVLVLLPAFAAITIITDGQLRGVRPPALRAYVHGLRATPALIGAGLLAALGALILTLFAAILFVLTLFGVLGSLIAIIGLLVWWANPSARRPWLRWLIVLTFPFGLPTYFSYRWALALPAVVLERAGPAAALRRSAALTDGAWFRLVGASMVLALVVNVLQALPSLLITMVAGAAGMGVFVATGSDSPTGLTTAMNVVNVAGQSLGQVIFGALPFIGLTLLFIDLRNRREGADIAERPASV